MEYANQYVFQLKDLDPLDIGKQYIGSLIEKKRFAEAASNLKIVNIVV